MRLTQIAFIAGLILARAHAQSTCVNFPAGFVPFSSISYVTAADSVGDHLVVGVPAPGALSLINASIPLPAFTNQTFCDAQVQLAPQQFYPNVYVPTTAELSGNFSAFSGLFVNGERPALSERSDSGWPVGQRVRLADRPGAGGVGNRAGVRPARWRFRWRHSRRSCCRAERCWWW